MKNSPLANLNTFSLKEQLEIISQHPAFIKYIENPCLKLQLKAINKSGPSLEYIKDPHPKVQLVAVKRNPWLLQYIKNPSLEILLLAYFLTHNYGGQYQNNSLSNLVVDKMKEFLKKMR
jgi:hypothetical protein